MALFGAALAKEILGYDDANKAFRPWWDTTQDFLMYGMIMLGIIVAPAAMIEGTPLICQECYKYNCDFFKKPANHDSSKADYNKTYEWRWVKKYCTSTAIHPFISYFPYVLFLMAFVMILLEQGFMKIFKAGRKLRIFYDLLVKESQSRTKPTENLKPAERFATDTEDRRRVIEVSHSFTSRHNLYTSYMARTILELILSSGMLVYLAGYGFPVLVTSKLIKCNVYGKFYECVGHPQNFYIIVLGLATFILVCFVLCSSFTLFWLSCPCLGILSNIMAKYSKFIHNHKRNGNDWVNASKRAQFVDEESETIYYNNRDIKLLLDLLATCSGIEHSLRILVLFDSNMKSSFSPGDLKFCKEYYHTYIPVNEVNVSTRSSGVKEDTILKKIVYDISIEFADAVIMAELLNNVDDIIGIYTVEIYPRTPRSSIHMAAKIISIKNDILPNTVDQRCMHSTRLYDLDPEQRYAVRVCSIINGLKIAQRIEIIKPIDAPITATCTMPIPSIRISDDDTAVITDLRNENHRPSNNVMLAPLKPEIINGRSNC